MPIILKKDIYYGRRRRKVFCRKEKTVKFANYYFKGKSMNNIGDNMQILAIDYIYQQMGVQDDIVYIDKNDLPTYEGEYVVSVSYTHLYTFTSWGNGHGVGMSQYGAMGLIANGADWKEVLSRYYPGTTLERV